MTTEQNATPDGDGNMLVELKNLGPMPYTAWVNPKGGGVIQLEGPNGSGKSTAIKAIHALAGGKEKGLSVRRGETMGEASGFGATLRLSTSSDRLVRGGQLWARSLGSDVDPSEIVDPGYEKRETRDMHRSRVLCSLLEIKPGLEHFHHLLDKKTIEALADERIKESETLPEQTKYLKLTIEQAARVGEVERDKLMSDSRAESRLAKDIDPNGPHDEVLLRSSTESALRKLQDAETRKAQAVARREQFETANRILTEATEAAGATSITDAESEWKKAVAEIDESIVAFTVAGQAYAASQTAMEKAQMLLSARTDATNRTKAQLDERRQLSAGKAAEIAALIATLEAAKHTHAAMQSEIAALEKELSNDSNAFLGLSREFELARSDMETKRAQKREAEVAKETAEKRRTSTQGVMEMTKRATASMQSARDVVAAGMGDPGPTDGELKGLRGDYEAASANQDRGILIREARKRLARAQELADAAQTEDRNVQRLRDAASACWLVVADQIAKIAPEGITFQDGVMVYDKPGVGWTPFDELSEGEKWFIVVPMCMRVVGRGGILSIKQEAWEGLQPSRQREIIDLAKKYGVWVITGKAADEPLHATVLE